MSSPKLMPKSLPELRESEAERLVYEAFKQGGNFLPQTVEEVEAAEAELAGKPVELPPHLRDPLAILKRKAKPRAVPHKPVSTDTTAAENMACAARNGSEIPPDVLAQMDADEARAEAERGTGND
jgi:hypothetical protein